MRIATAVVCDYASVREGLLTVVSGGITRMWREELPAPLGASLALLIEIDPADRSVPHELSVTITAPSGTEVARAGGGFQLATEQPFDPDESALMPLPLDLRDAGVTEYGWHTIRIVIDDGEPTLLRFKVARRPEPAAAAIPMNRAARRRQARHH